jgi:hypothetical protein
MHGVASGKSDGSDRIARKCGCLASEIERRRPPDVGSLDINFQTDKPIRELGIVTDLRSAEPTARPCIIVLLAKAQAPPPFKPAYEPFQL